MGFNNDGRHYVTGVRPQHLLMGIWLYLSARPVFSERTAPDIARMLIEIPQLLSAEEVRRLRELADKGQTRDGKTTAGDHVKHLKNNLEIQLERKYAVESRGVQHAQDVLKWGNSVTWINAMLVTDRFARRIRGIIVHVKHMDRAAVDKTETGEISVTDFLSKTPDHCRWTGCESG